MNNEIITKPGFYLAGLAIKTAPATAPQDIFTLWQKFISQNIQQQIPKTLSSEVYALYTDYEGDYTQPYLCLIGCPVSSITDLPPGLIGKTVPAASYALFCAKGNYPDALIQKWTEIWQSPLPRAYQADFELYQPSFFQNPEQDTRCPVDQQKEVAIYVGIR